MPAARNAESRVIAHLRHLIAQGSPGVRLPTVRKLIDDLRASPGTIQRAMTQLSHEGLIEARPGSGTYILSRSDETDAPRDMGWQSVTLGSGRGVNTEGLDDFGTLPRQSDIVLNAGYPPDELQPLAALGKAYLRAGRYPDAWGRMPIEGVSGLRHWFAAQAGHIYEPHEVLICPGTQAALSAAFRALAAPGDTVLMESPTYIGAIAAASAVGLKITPVPSDRDGVNTALLEDAFSKTGARLFYSQPCYANPTGSVLSNERRADVVAILRRHGAFLVEDDWARDFHLDSSPIPAPLALNDPLGHVVYVRSLTKCAAPGLRVGALCARGAALARLRQARLIDDFFVPGLLQYTTLELVSAPSWQTHLKRLRMALRERRDTLALALRSHLGPDSLRFLPKGGLHLWIKLPAGISDKTVQILAAQQGVLVSPGHLWFPGEPIGGYLRLSFASARPEIAREGAQRIASIIESLRR